MKRLFIVKIFTFFYLTEDPNRLIILEIQIKKNK